MAARSREDLRERDREIIRRLDVLAEARGFGLRPVEGAAPGEGGWLPCHAVGREDTDPSASFNVGDSPLRGRYRDFADGEGRAISFFDLAARAGRFPDWRAARDHYARITGLSENGPSRKGGRVYSTEAEARDAARRSAARELKAKPSELRLEQYVYRDADGSEVYRVLKFCGPGGKTCRPIHEADGVWRIGLPSARIIYRLPELISALTQTPQQPVLVLEGEKDVEAAWKLGYVATTNVGGAGKWTEADSAHLRGRHVVVICDNDEAGRKHGEKAVASLLPVAESVRLIPALPGVPEKGDLSDWIASGGDFESLRQLILSMPRLAPPPPPDVSEPGEREKTVSNAYVFLDEEGKERREPKSILPIVNEIFELTAGWPKKVGGILFAPPKRGVVRYLQTPADLMAFVGEFCDKPPEIHEKTGYHTKADIFSEVREKADNYEGIEPLPHEPPIGGVYYACDPPRPGDGRRLQEFLDRFRFETDVDRSLYLAFLMSLVWGGDGGTRPGFVFTADSGRGAGKTTAVKMAAHLFGGSIEVRQREDRDGLMKRLLSPEALTKRIVLFDNVKSQRFSSDELEGLITTPVLSGYRLYAGEGRRPNTLTYCITSNGASLSTDLAQRVVVIKLRRPEYDGNWEEATRAFIDRHRDEIIADLVGLLRSERATLEAFSRWGTWEHAVLSRVPAAAVAQEVIRERQREVNVDEDEADIVAEYVYDKLLGLGRGFCPDSERIFIPNPLATEWYNAATNERHSTSKVSRLLQQISSESKTFPISKSRSNGQERGFIWTGRNAPPDAQTRRDLARRTGESARVWDPAEGNPSREDTAGTRRGRFPA